MRALRLFPGFQPATHALGVLELAEGRPASAVRYFEESLRARPGYAPSREMLGIARARLSRTGEAAPADPRDPPVSGRLAQADERALPVTAERGRGATARRGRRSSR
jgi:predicted Zn-dependent protease